MVGIEAVHQGDHLLGGVAEVEDGREGVQAGGVELVAVLHGELTEGLKIPLLDMMDHLDHALWDHGFGPVLEDENRGG